MELPKPQLTADFDGCLGGQQRWDQVDLEHALLHVRKLRMAPLPRTH